MNKHNMLENNPPKSVTNDMWMLELSIFANFSKKGKMGNEDSEILTKAHQLHSVEKIKCVPRMTPAHNHHTKSAEI